MTADTQEIDARRARTLYEFMEGPVNTADALRQARQWDLAKDLALAIRLSDEAAGYILVKHEGVISSEDMKPVKP